jgi:hypothetical protein
MQCDSEVYKVLEAENMAAARDPKRTPFSYIDLTSNAVLPLWLAADAIGGSASFTADLQDSQVGSISAIGRALQAATSQKKIFRSQAQWTGSFSKYAAAAIVAGHLTAADVLTYQVTLAKLQDGERAKGFYLMVLYDDLFRRNLSKRAEARDPSLVVSTEVAHVDKELLETCRARVEGVMQAHGLTEVVTGSRSGVGLPSPAPTHGGTGGSGELLTQSFARQAAAAEQAASRAEAARRSMEKAAEAHQDVSNARSRKRNWYLDNLGKKGKSPRWTDDRPPLQRRDGKGSKGSKGSKGKGKY